METLDAPSPLGSPSTEKIWEQVAALEVDPEEWEEYKLGEASADVTPSKAQVFHNSPPSLLYEHAMRYEPGSHIVSSGALAVLSGKKTGRSPKDKRVVEEACSVDDIWWGKVNAPLSKQSFLSNRERAVDYLNLQERLYVVDAWAGWEPAYRLPIRIITSRAYHALFMQNMLVPITPDDQAEFEKEKPFLILNAGCFPCNRFTQGMTSATSVSLSFERGEMVILGTQYAGEMKKGVFTVMMYHMPFMPNRELPLAERGLPMHASANIGKDNDVSIFFGLSGTGKTTLSTDPNRDLIGDDEHVWTSDGVFNIEGGCYAKTIGLTEEKEPEVYRAIRFGSILENVGYNTETREVDFDDVSKTENTRVSYPLQYIPNARIPATVHHHPKNIILLTCDAFGILPPVSKLTSEQLMYHFISGYTAKVAGTEMGITEPVATFSACFGGPFLALHPNFYAEMLAAKLEKFGANAWLINSGWVGGPYGVGERCKLKYTRALIDAIHDGTLDKLEESKWETTDVFNLKIPTVGINGVPLEILRPETAWTSSGQSKEAYMAKATELAGLFTDNFKEYADRCTEAVIKAAPKA
jgi:phosphoenolpyruvate carboxykinase (ATP)